MRRNNIAHYSRTGWRQIGQKIAVPLSSRGYFPWKVRLKTDKLTETGLRTAWDLRRAEISLNDIYLVLIKGWEKRFADMGIEVKTG